MSEGRSTWASNGFKIAPFGKGRNAIQSAHTNDLVDALNMLGTITVVRGTEDKVLYADNGVIIQLKSSAVEAAESSLLNPFSIYRTDTSWLHYKVTTGWVVRGGVPILASNIETEFPISASVLYYWFYMELTDTTAVISTSATTLAWSCTKIPLGWVDTLTGVATTTPTIVNLNRDHLFNPL